MDLIDNELHFWGISKHDFAKDYLDKYDLIDVSEADLVNTYKKIKLELANYDKKLGEKKEIIFFNKSDLIENKEIIKKIKEFEKKIKSKYEIISVFSNKDLQKVKKLLIKNVA